MAPFAGAFLTENFNAEVIATGTTPKRSSGGFAFEVQIKTPEKAQQHPGVRARLESYSTECSSGDDGSDTSNKPAARERTLRASLEAAAKQEKRRQAHIANVAGRAKEHAKNVKKKATALQQRRVEQMEAEKIRLDAAMAQTIEVGSANVAKRSSLAGQHNKVVEEKLNKHKETVDTRQEAEKYRLETTMAQKVEAGSANVAKRGSLAGKHNRVVDEKVHKHKEAAHIRQMKILERHEKKRGSKVIGVPYSSVLDVPIVASTEASIERA